MVGYDHEVEVSINGESVLVVRLYDGEQARKLSAAKDGEVSVTLWRVTETREVVNDVTAEIEHASTV